MQDLIMVVSFLMTTIAGVFAMASKDRQQRTSSMTVGFVFLVAFLFVFFGRKAFGQVSPLIQKSACSVSLIMAVVGGLTAMFHEDRDRQFVSGAVGFVFLITSLLLLW